MSEDVIKIILNKLNQIDAKQDVQAAQLSSINAKLATIEEKQKQQEKINAEVDQLRELKDEGMGAKNIVAWLVTTLLSVLALVKNHLF